MIESAHPLLFGVPQVHDDSGDITPAELAALLDVTQAQLARTLGVSRQLLSRSPGSARVQRGLRRVEYLFARLRNLTGSAVNARMWLKMGHPDFDGIAPVELLEEGHIEAVEDLVLAIETGSPR